MTTFQSVLFVTRLEWEKFHYLFKYIQTVCLKHVKTDSDIVKLVSLDTVFTGTCLDMNTVSTGKSICLNLHRRHCKDREHAT